MSIENVRTLESFVIDEHDPRYDGFLQADDPALHFVRDKHGKWSVRGTGEPVTFANAYEVRRYKRLFGVG
jgi:hypothetical protein